jgi:ubiquinone/menaquinone biosynthesis C-methylase UbiE
MAETIRFDDGAAYEQMMGIWSRSVGEIFLDWLAPPAGLHWIDVGCGNGAFTELLVTRCQPAEVQGIDPSDGQLAYARTRPGARPAQFQQGDAMALPFPADRFDAAAMALVLAFVPEPRLGVEEMARVVRPGGLVAAYMWDMLGGGFPLDPVLQELRAMGVSPTRPPRMEASQLGAMQGLWSGAGLIDVESREIVVQRVFADFEQFWGTSMKSSTLAPTVAKMEARELEMLKERVRSKLDIDRVGAVHCTARAHAVKGRVPGG